jgi:hypothetical protein
MINSTINISPHDIEEMGQGGVKSHHPEKYKYHKISKIKDYLNGR